MTSGAGPHGVLVVDKPSGPTSHDIVAQARRVFGTRRVGHAGTLDPMATGVLVLLLGEATKLSDVATSEHKAYLAEVSFGRATHSHDAEGETLEEVALEPGWLDVARLERALASERLREQQLPPAVSAIKVGGQRAHRLTRRGEAPELAARPVRVHALRLLGQGDATLQLELLVSKGYYVRSLARDLGAALGVPAHLSRLRRVQSGSFRIEQACAWPPEQRPELLPLREAIEQLLPTARLTPLGVLRARQGKRLEAADFERLPAGPSEVTGGSPSPVFAWTDGAGNPVALGRREGDVFRVQRGFAAEPGVEAADANGDASLADGKTEAFSLP